jgi:hypothetical protein
MQMSGAEERMKHNPNVYRQFLQEKHNAQLVETIKTGISFPFHSHSLIAQSSSFHLFHRHSSNIS